MPASEKEKEFLKKRIEQLEKQLGVAFEQQAFAMSAVDEEKIKLQIEHLRKQIEEAQNDLNRS